MKVLTILLLMLLVFGQEQNCVLKRDRSGIKVWVCSNDNDRLKSLRTEFTLENKTLDELEAYVMNVPDYTKWQYNVYESSVLKKISEDEMIYRTAISAPWPVANREMIVRFIKVKDASNHSMKIYTTTEPSDHPTTEGMVRVPDSQASWTVTTEGTSLKVVYTLRIDPGGSVPIWLVNMALADGPYTSFLKLKEILK